MTLVAVHVEQDRAVLVTDGVSHSAECMDFAPARKARLFPAWDLVMGAIGPAELGDAWARALEASADTLQDLDHIDEQAPEALRRLWQRIEEERGGLGDGVSSGQVFQVGWSPRRDRFAAYLYRSEDAWERTDLSDAGLYCDPAPVAGLPQDVPATDRQWAALVKACHEDWTLRSVMDPPKVYIGGEVVLTELSRGTQRQREVHRFPMKGAQWRRSVIGTLHPDGQMGPCQCGTGVPQATCHLLARDTTKPCPCGSGKSLAECHLIPPGDRRVLAHYLAHRRDYESTRPYLAEVYRRARPGENWPPEKIQRLNPGAYG